MLKFNDNNINGWCHSDSNIIKVYRNDAILYYRVSLNGSQEPCYAVVNDISQYQDREFIDVFNKADGKWYKLNNLNQYEVYGAYGSGRNITYYDGKLTIDDGYEYMYSGSSWVNVGEVSGSTIIVKSPEYLSRTSSANGYIALGEYFTENTVIDIDFQMTHPNGNVIIGDYGSNDNDDWRVFLNYYNIINNLLVYDFNNSRQYYNTGNWNQRFHLEIGNYYIKDINTGNYLINSTKKTGFSRPNQMYLFHMEGSQTSSSHDDYGNIYSIKIYQNGVLSKDFIPWTDENGTYALYDKLTNSVFSSTGQMTGSSVVNDIQSPIGRLPAGYVELDYVESTGQSSVNLNLYPLQTAGNSFSINLNDEMSYTDGWGEMQTMLACQKEISPYPGFSYRLKNNAHTTQEVSTNLTNMTYSITSVSSDTKRVEMSCPSVASNLTHNYPLNLFSGLDGSMTPFRYVKGKVYNMDVTVNNTLSRDLVPAKTSGNTYGLYDLVGNTLYSAASGTAELSGGTPVIASSEYPVYYTDIQDPPTSVTFSSMTEAEQYECPYVGLKATIAGDKYIFAESGGTYYWDAVQGGLPDVPFSVNYNAKNYYANTKTLLKTEGQLVDVDAVITAGTPTVGDGYLTIAANTRATISGYANYFNRTNNSPELTIVSKQMTNGNNCHMFANRDNSYNWMYRCYSNKLTLHGSSEKGQVAVTTQPVIESVRVDSSRNVLYNNYTDNTTSSATSFSYGSTNSGKFAMFQGYASNSGENFIGDFYWVYMAQGYLTDEQIQQVIDYNENL